MPRQTTCWPHPCRSLLPALLLAVALAAATDGRAQTQAAEGVEIRIDTNRTHLLLVTPDGKHNSALRFTRDFNGLAFWNQAKGTWSGVVKAHYWEDKPVHSNGVAWLRGRYGATNAPESAIVYEETWTLRPPDGVTIALTRRNPGAVRAKMPGATLFRFNFGGGAKPLASDRFGSRRFYDFGRYRLEFESDTGLELQYHPDAQRLYLGGLTIDPGQEKTQTVTLRVAPGSAADTNFNPVAFFAADYRAFAAKHPRVLHWPDRRAILANMSCKSARGYRLGYTTNPRGWNAGADVTTTNGFASFKAGKLGEARRLVKICRNQNAQGVIIWDLEGEECRHAITYNGSPDRLMLQSPEMDEVADEFFAIFAEAGVRAGVCIRPQRLQLRSGRHPDTDPGNQDGPNTRYSQDNRLDAEPMLELLAGKIAYAYGRWQVTLFYIDSPVGLSAAMCTELARRFPDCLLIPEYPSPDWYGASAPLFVVSPHARHIWPEAFGVVCIGGFAGGHPKGEQIRQSLEQGSILIDNDGSPICKLYDTVPRPDWHDPARFKWNENQPVSRALTERWIVQGTREMKP